MFEAGNILKPLDGGRCIVMINVTPENYHKYGVNASKPGACGFGGMWYGNDPTNHRHFGKIYEPTHAEHWECIGTIKDFTVEQIKEMTA
jgi:hypothetical protein